MKFNIYKIWLEIKNKEDQMYIFYNIQKKLGLGIIKESIEELDSHED